MRVVSLICCIIFYVTSLQAQIFYRKSEFGLAAGTSNYYGDLNTGLDVHSARYSAALFYKYNVTPYIALKLGAAFAHIEGDDKFSSNYFQQTRNLRFKNNLAEIAIGTELHFFSYKIGDFENRFTPYVSLGAALFFHNPYTTYEGKNYFLRPLGTEGQNYEAYKDRKYQTHSFAFPVGIGTKFWVAHGITFYVELLHRFTLTDYLDDVSTTYVGIDKFQDNTPSPYPIPAAVLQDRSTNQIGTVGKQRGISTTKDQYTTFQIGLSFRLPTYKCPDEL